MSELFKIVVYVLQRMLHDSKPLFDKPKEIQIFVSDGIRKCEIVWNNKTGVVFK